MREVKLFIASSLDGYIARAGGELDWLYTEGDYGCGPFAASVDTVLMGRRTYEQSLASPAYPYRGKTAWVFSRREAGRRDENARFVDESPSHLVTRLRRFPGRDLWLVGGGELVRAFLAEDLVDRIDLFIHPVVLGSGFPLFPAGGVQARLEVGVREEIGSGLVHLAYTRPLAMAA